MQHFDAGNYHLINIHKCLFIQCTAVARELYGDNSSAVCDRGGHGTRLLFNFSAFLKLYLMLFWASINFS